MLTPERWQIVEGLFHEALTYPAPQRSAFVESSCAADPELRSELESLLAAEADSDGRESIAAAVAVAADWGTHAADAAVVGRDFDNYHVVSLLGVGGMGEVYLAEDRELGRKVALKLLPAAFTTDPGRLRRFADEARAASALNHPNILTVHQIGEMAGRRFIATEFIDGETLRDRIARGPLPIGDALDIAVQVTRALGAAHDAGIVHRDIKPDNIMIRRDGYVKVLDFGLAKLADPARSSLDHRPQTREGAVVGTFDYMAPEQANGQPVDARADLYSLSVVLYEMVTGVLPRELGSGSGDASSAARAVPPPLLRLLQRGVASDPAKRQQTAGDLHRDLHALQQKRAGVSSRTGALRWAAAAGVVIALGGALALWRNPALLRSAPDRGGAKATTLAVLPFQTVTLSEGDQYLGLGIADAIITQLGVLQQLQVRPTTSVREFTQPNVDVIAVASKLQVDHVLSGLIQRDQNHVRVTVQLVDVRTKAQRWTSRIDVEFRDLFSLQDTVAQRVAAVLVSDMSGAERGSLSARQTTDPEAYQLYMQGRFFLAKATPAGARQAVQLLQQAVEHDPRYALAYAALAEGHRQLGSTLFGASLAADGMKSARDAANRAIELDASLADGYTVLGAIKFQYDWDAPGAGAALERAVRLGPNLSVARRYYGWYLAALGRGQEGVEQLRRARQLDPLSALTAELLGTALNRLGHHEEAIREFEAAADLEPTSSRALARQAWALEVVGRAAETIPLWQEVYRRAGRPDDADTIGRLYATGGLPAFFEFEAQLNIAARNYLAATYSYLMLNRTDDALDQIAKGIETRGTWVPFMDVEPWFDRIRTHPRFVALRRQTGWNLGAP